MNEKRTRGVAIFSPAIALAHVTIAAKGARRAHFRGSVVESSSKVTAAADADSPEGAVHTTEPNKEGD